MSTHRKAISAVTVTWLRTLDEDDNVDKAILNKIKDAAKTTDLGRVIGVVASLMESPDHRIQARAALLLGKFDSSAAQALLQVFLNHSDHRVRIAATEAAFLTDSSWALIVSASRMNDADPRVQERAVELCKTAERDWLKNSLQELIDRGDTSSLNDAVTCLSKTLEADLFEVFEGLYQKVELSMKRKLAESLAALDPATTGSFAAGLLQRVKGPDARKMLEAALGSSFEASPAGDPAPEPASEKPPEDAVVSPPPVQAEGAPPPQLPPVTQPRRQIFDEVADLVSPSEDLPPERPPARPPVVPEPEEPYVEDNFEFELPDSASEEAEDREILLVDDDVPTEEGGNQEPGIRIEMPGSPFTTKSSQFRAIKSVEEELASWKQEKSSIVIEKVDRSDFSDSMVRIPRPTPASSSGDASRSAATPRMSFPATEPTRPPPTPKAPVKSVQFSGDDRERLFDLLRVLVTKGGSDLHLKPGLSPYIRVQGRMQKLPNPPLTPSQLTASIASVATPQQMENFLKKGDMDTSVSIPGAGRFRVSVLRSRGAPGLVARLIPSDIPAIANLGLPPILLDLAREPAGLYLVTGPTGSGKSTTLAVILDQINSTRRSNIVTIEDPIEFLHRDKQSSIIQRQVGTDVRSFADGVRFASRMDPDVIMVGELRDQETIRAAFHAAGAGRLVLATVHTNSASKTMERIIYAFPANEQGYARVNLSNSLLAVVSQTLVRTVRGRLIPAIELMVVNTAIRKAIRENNAQAIYSAIESGAEIGMITLEQTLVRLYKSGTIMESELLRTAPNPALLEHLLRTAPTRNEEE